MGESMPFAGATQRKPFSLRRACRKKSSRLFSFPKRQEPQAGERLREPLPRVFRYQNFQPRVNMTF